MPLIADFDNGDSLRDRDLLLLQNNEFFPDLFDHALQVITVNVREAELGRIFWLRWKRIEWNGHPVLRSCTNECYHLMHSATMRVGTNAP